MKKLIILLVLLAMLTPVFAQNNSSDKDDMYYLNVPVERIITTRDGYIVQYRTSGNVLGTIGIPVEWFSDSAGSAEIVRLATGGDWPSMSVFYRNGEFSHIRLYIHKAKGHSTWGNVPIGTDLSRFYVDKENFSIKY